ncbi:MAG: VWA domain-containing protein, partial [Bacteroidota bacterium]
DVRNIDWNVTARTGEPFVKIFEEERELTVMLLIDVSQSAYFGTVNQFKQSIITEISAVLSFSAIQNNDKVGVIFFTDKIEKFIPPKKGRSHILYIIRELIDFHPQRSRTNIGQALQFLNNVVKKRSICFILSDYMSEGYEAPLRIASKRHDIIGVHLYDFREQELPHVGLIRGMDAETGERAWMDTSSASLRDEYARWFNVNYNYFKNTFNRSGLDVVSIRTDENYVTALMNFFKKRIK